MGEKDGVNSKGVAESVLEGSPRRLRTIYRTNISTAHAAGREASFERTKATRPYGQYISALKTTTRHFHRELHLKTFPLDDPFWDRFTPPIDFNCYCSKRALSEADVKRKGIKVLSSQGRMVREDRLVSKKTGEMRPVWGYKLPGGRKIFPGVGFDNNPWKAAWQPDLDKYDYDIAKKYVEGVITGPAFKRFFEGKDGGKFPVAVLDPGTQKKAGAKSRTVLLSGETRDAHPRITLAQYQGIQANIGVSKPIYLPDNRIGYLTTEGSGQRFTVLKSTRDKEELYFLSTYRVRPNEAAKLKKKETKK